MLNSFDQLTKFLKSLTGENMYKINSDELNDFHKSSGLEWLETNGLGEWASSTVQGLNKRRYHGLLVTSLNPPSNFQLNEYSPNSSNSHSDNFFQSYSLS